jgi:hypothetical protein
MADWYTVDDAEAQQRLVDDWPDAPIERLNVCRLILETAREQVIDYAPVLADDAPTPQRWVYAQLQQATNLWNAGRVNSSGDVGEGQWNYTPRPLDKTVKGIIRPPKGRPRVR